MRVGRIATPIILFRWLCKPIIFYPIVLVWRINYEYSYGHPSLSVRVGMLLICLANVVLNLYPKLKRPLLSWIPKGWLVIPSNKENFLAYARCNQCLFYRDFLIHYNTSYISFFYIFLTSGLRCMVSDAKWDFEEREQNRNYKDVYNWNQNLCRFK